MRPIDMRHTRRALSEFWRRRESLLDLLEHVHTEEDNRIWVGKYDALVAGVQEAYYLDTSDRNSWDVCRHITISHAASMVRYVDEGGR